MIQSESILVAQGVQLGVSALYDEGVRWVRQCWGELQYSEGEYSTV